MKYKNKSPFKKVEKVKAEKPEPKVERPTVSVATSPITGEPISGHQHRKFLRRGNLAAEIEASTKKKRES